MDEWPDRPETELSTDDDDEVGIETERWFSAAGSIAALLTGRDVTGSLSSSDLENAERYDCSLLRFLTDKDMTTT